ncbi:MAG: energy-coupled thiamine transporter ThiT [Clostridia bacterium]|nr:energy-coupled thiamine transporter ThiT [Clostridia bacterium]
MTNTNKTKNTKIVKLTECAMLLALSIILSFVTVYQMPMGGGITLLSMLPVMLVSIKYGIGTGLSVSLTFSLFQLLQGILSGNVFVYCTTASAQIICALFDYIVPFAVLGFAGIFVNIGKKNSSVNAYILKAVSGIAIMIFLRFVCHYITGVVIWGQWAENMSPYLYSLIYNAQYMLPECIFTAVAAAILLRVNRIRQLLSK